MSKITSSLFINALQLNVYLGWSNKERARKQTVWLDASIVFPKTPKACEDDDIKNTVCYADLITLINKKLSAKKFRLLEHLGAVIYKTIKTATPNKTSIGVTVTKYPKIADLNGGVSFHYGDNQ